VPKKSTRRLVRLERDVGIPTAGAWLIAMHEESTDQAPGLRGERARSGGLGPAQEVVEPDPLAECPFQGEEI
jgi:hypothetical protein